MNITHSLKTLTLPLVIAVGIGVLFNNYLDTLSAIEAKVEVKQEPLLRQLVFEVRAFDGRAFNLTVNGRQITDKETSGFCDIAWKGQIRQLVSFAGTVEVGGQMFMDSWINETEEGLPKHIKQELQGTSLTSRSCEFDVLSVDVRER